MKCFIFLSILIMSGLVVEKIMSDVEKPDYDILSSEGNIEIRAYKPLVIAEVLVKGQRKESISEGFRLLADYIFGNNESNKKISMTAPVEQTRQKNIKEEEIWKVNFVMPRRYTIETLPKPMNPRVKFKEVPFGTYVVIRFSGINDYENLDKHQKYLESYIQEKGLLVSDFPKYAFYDPPWTDPSIRRNEIIFKVE
ncbi:hypothetical protein AB834_00540 [PVC group bacterium (ex Bugula neritina AB1)]|nr:hypothetical protein AB834_00540 [PVC group bacterium (ex Bugula neritina AB1)]